MTKNAFKAAQVRNLIKAIIADYRIIAKGLIIKLSCANHFYVLTGNTFYQLFIQLLFVENYLI